MKKATYKSSGVDIGNASEFKRKIKPLVRKSFSTSVLNDIGSFGSFFKFPKGKFKEPVLVSSADGVGTKLKIAGLAHKHDTVGIDAVAMNVNDILCVGAEPLFFLDYIAYSQVSQKVLVDIVKGITRGCVESGCSLIGGETAQMPGMYARGEYDIAGFCVGAVERAQIIDGSTIKPGDAVIGLASSGIHSNGYSLVRKVFSNRELKHYSSELLKPTHIYVKPVLQLLRNTQYSILNTIKGIAHITGGAFYDKIARILPEGVDVILRKNSWPVPAIFKLIQRKGNIEDKEMYHTLNMGVGMILVVAPSQVSKVSTHFDRCRIPAWVIGEVVKGKRAVVIA